ncbi:MAG: 5'-nucleotidase C-terminal domain-containing protein, partial [Myxococcota bacterium]
ITELQGVVTTLKNVEKVDVVVVLAHAGTDLDKPDTAESWQIAAAVEGVDVVLSGHTHLLYPAVLVENTRTKKKVLVEEPEWAGDYVAKVVLSVDGSGNVSFDMTNTKAIAVNDKTPADQAYLPLVNEVINELEADRMYSGRSFLEMALSNIEGAPVTHDPSKTGDLYFRLLGQTQFEMTNPMYRETAMLRMAADAMLTASEAYTGKTDLAVNAYGIMRDGIWVGNSGKVTFTDLFRVLPLGISPVNGTPGYPLTKFYVAPIELKAVLEQTTTSYGTPDNANTFMVTSGLCFWYDTSRKAFDPAKILDPTNGRITKIAMATNHQKLDECDTVVYTLENGWDSVKTPQLFSVTVDYFLLMFASGAGVTPKTATGAKYTVLTDTIIKRGDMSEVKTFEALGTFVKGLCDGGAYIPARYNDNDAAGAGPFRAICTGPLCVK